MLISTEQIEADFAELRAEIPDRAWVKIPDYMHEGLLRWLLYGIVPGDFLTAVICNDLMEACRRADDANKHLLFHYCAFLYNHAPIGSYGGPIAFETWRRQGGIKHFKRELA